MKQKMMFRCIPYRNLPDKCSKILCLISFLILLTHSSGITEYVRTGLTLWAWTILPVLLPFIILSRFWIKCGIPEMMTGWGRRLFRNQPAPAVSLPLFFLGLSSGFPIGAVYVRHYYESRLLSKRRAEEILPICSFASPMFLAGYVHSLFAGSRKEWILFLFSLYLPMLLLLMFYLFSDKTLIAGQRHTSFLPGLESSVFSDGTTGRRGPGGHALTVAEIWSSSVEIIITIGIYVMLFSVILGLAENYKIFDTAFARFLLSNLEITTGCQYAASAIVSEGFPTQLLLLVVVEFGGLCSCAQTAAVLTGTDLSMNAYVRSKLLATCLGMLVYSILHRSFI